MVKQIKICSKCDIEKEYHLFNKDPYKKDGFESSCKECKKIISKKSYNKNKDTFQKHYDKNKEIIKEKNKRRNKDPEYKIKNKEYRKKSNENLKTDFIRKEKERNWMNNYRKNKFKNDIQFKIKTLIRGLINSHLKFKNIKKQYSSLDYLGCNINFYREYLEKQFLPEMNWDNHGKLWEIDHKVSISKYNLDNKEQLKEAFNYLNTQPLFKTTKIAESLGYEGYIGNRNKGGN